MSGIFKQLLGAEKEANEIARLFNTQALTGDVATMKKYPNPRDWEAFTLICVL